VDKWKRESEDKARRTVCVSLGHAHDAAQILYCGGGKCGNCLKLIVLTTRNWKSLYLFFSIGIRCVWGVRKWVIGWEIGKMRKWKRRVRESSPIPIPFVPILSQSVSFLGKKREKIDCLLFLSSHHPRIKGRRMDEKGKALTFNHRVDYKIWGNSLIGGCSAKEVFLIGQFGMEWGRNEVWLMGLFRCFWTHFQVGFFQKSWEGLRWKWPLSMPSLQSTGIGNSSATPPRSSIDQSTLKMEMSSRRQKQVSPDSLPFILIIPLYCLHAHQILFTSVEEKPNKKSWSQKKSCTFPSPFFSIYYKRQRDSLNFSSRREMKKSRKLSQIGNWLRKRKKRAEAKEIIRKVKENEKKIRQWKYWPLQKISFWLKCWALGSCDGGNWDSAITLLIRFQTNSNACENFHSKRVKVYVVNEPCHHLTLVLHFVYSNSISRS